MKHICIFLSVAALGFFSDVAFGDDSENLDSNFLIKAASCDNAEIEIGKLADKRAGSQQVKEFAAQLVNDHRKCADRVGLIFKNRKQSIVSGFEKDVTQSRDRLIELKGAEFDREYLRWTITTHQNVIPIFENQIKNGNKAELRAYAQEHVGILRNHLKRAQELLKSIN